jgi:hypothetical protein
VDIRKKMWLGQEPGAKYPPMWPFL